MHNGRGETWLNRFPGDTFSIFNWKGGLPIRRADLDGDGLLEYIDNAGYIYKAVPGSLPDSVPVHQISIPTKIYYIGDVNNDGTDDILLSTAFTENGLSLIAGNKDIRLVRKKDSVITAPYSSNTERKSISGVYRSKDGTFRIITWRVTTTDISIIYPYKDNFDIYKAEFVQGESKLKSFNHIGIIPGQKTGRMYLSTLDLWHSKQTGRVLVFAIYDKYLGTAVYDLTDDKIELAGKLKYTGYMYFPNYSLNRDSIYDWILYAGGDIRIFDGSKEPGSVDPFVFSHFSKGDMLPGVIEVINDLNNDGIPDVAIGSDQDFAPNLCGLFVTPAIPSQVLDELSTEYKDTVIVRPHPILQQAQIEYSIEQSGEYRIILCDQTGRMQRSLYDGQLERGHHQLTIDCNGISSGIYMLTVNGKASKNQKNVVFIVE
jgi:hypothetical protein